jgi:hypothetical protein
VKRLICLLVLGVCGLACLLFAATNSGTANAEIAPGPTPTPSSGPYTSQTSAPGLTSFGPPAGQPRQNQDINICALSDEFHHGGDETLVFTNFALDLPAGDYMAGTVTRGNVGTVEVCYRPDGSVLKLHDVSGGELSRSARSGDAHVAFDAIVASVRPPFDASRGVRVPTLTTIAP